ncbi:hypothetical protein PF005_g18488 [Phytophthora fragariae]|uniref:Secreted protein n=1 Tax=Phytophthora fragariae TaxID=53985 RepID=A0A6A3X587_9STRA|nr:hypothetical protein PF003_g27379 [Phytophthora fragariae]KAE8925230.1 hypothetical protein PF009_g24556 [Phytophthora fragariae]KAE8984067.1 hypothetical protein PF011_g20923 [Phytophthora fragariae]KAE9078476.1 hypothetical protein PF010_g23106 [Phytophthora fragariae]KAE9078576.1 hypothetical protein PF007_g23792 [Phytophthora fragariae]
MVPSGLVLVLFCLSVLSGSDVLIRDLDIAMHCMWCHYYLAQGFSRWPFVLHNELLCKVHTVRCYRRNRKYRYYQVLWQKKQRSLRVPAEWKDESKAK